MELADLPGHPARAAARRHKAAVEGWFAEQLAGAGVPRARDLAREIMLLIEGCLSLVLIHGDTRYADAAAAAARQLVNASAPTTRRGGRGESERRRGRR
jgi:hypothetical protein